MTLTTLIHLDLNIHLDYIYINFLYNIEIS
jgi:hypothetical protein